MMVAPGTPRQRLAGAVAVLLAFATYYFAYFAPPHLIGAVDPDRYYHLAVSRLTALDFVLPTLPQVEDLGWGRYFPDKEFLFHVLTGAAHWLGGSAAVLAVVPLLGIAIMLCLYTEISRVTRPLAATLVVVMVPIATAGFLFRLSLLRPHLLAILWFSLLLAAILRGRPRLAALAAALFALSYHAFYLVALVAGVAWLLRNSEGLRGKQVWLWCLAGFVAGLLLNPYFPTNLQMGWLTLKLALGTAPVEVADQGMELRAFGWQKLALAYGFIPVAVVVSASMAYRRRAEKSAVMTGMWFLLCITAGFWVLGTRSPRAMEYATPACVLLVGYASAIARWRYWLPAMLFALLGIQGYLAGNHYIRNWQVSPTAYYRYAELLRDVPRREGGLKVFNCEWEAGSYILLARPDLRFVDLLEPTLLWDASRDKYLAREGLRAGAFDDPRLILRGLFKADYVLCSSPKLIEQMDGRPEDFSSMPGTKGDKLRLFAIRPD